MNPGQSFYGCEDWSYPSPSNSPTSRKKNAVASYHFDTFETSPNTDWQAQPSSSNADKIMSSAHSRHISAPITGAINPSVLHSTDSGQTQTSQGMSFSQMQDTTASLSNSFLDNFDSTTIHDSFNFDVNDGGDIMTSSQMQTPPPTRDASSRKKSRKPPIRFTTPATATPRRSSMPASSWVKKNAEAPTLGESPQFITPLRFSAADSAPFPNFDGPATAPAEPHDNIFWDPNFKPDNSFGFPTIVEDPFDAISHHVSGNLSFDTSPSMRHNRAMTGRGPPQQEMRASSARIGRPQTTQSFDASRMQTQSSPIRPSTGINPNQLWSANGPSTEQLRISDVASRKVNDGGVPYQYHFEELKREKEHQRRLRALRSERSSSRDSSQNLRRSVTTSRARTNSAASQIHRESSMLKRGRSDSQGSGHKKPARRAVMLTVDESGRAKTVIKPIYEDTAEHSRSSSVSGRDNASDSSELTERASSSRRNNAQDALIQMRREQQRKKKSMLANLDTSYAGLG
ncbi:MAG: hypothetical protein M1831_002090 [Alyxoria varia]|nr:MAG: hypothetical protein M1831_002090 [Alyxoria varia]